MVSIIMINKGIKIFFETIAVLIMIGFIPFVHNDYILTLIYVGIILISFYIKKTKGDIRIFFFGFIVMIVCEFIFTSTGVETFNRNSLMGLMPLWLPFLWGYSFVAIKRGLKILEI